MISLLKSRYFILSFLSLVLSVNLASAQVTIGSDKDPEKAALLELKSFNATNPGGATTDEQGGGLLFSRVALEEKSSLKPFIPSGGSVEEKSQHTGLVVYNVQDIPAQSLKEGLYMWNGSQWVQITGKVGREKFFYMPALPINTSTLGTQPPVDLHSIYKEQFISPKAKSAGAPSQIPVFENATDLYYYVTSYDETVFSNFTITADGKMTYEVINNANSWSFVNVVFVIK